MNVRMEQFLEQELGKSEKEKNPKKKERNMSGIPSKA